MANRKTYSEKLKDPRWQKKRLEILERDGWTCQVCFDTENTLSVHHRKYSPGIEPWEYQDHILVTLCEVCHEAEREERQKHEKNLLSILKEKGFMADDILALSCGFHFMEMPHRTEVTANAIEWMLRNEPMMTRLMESYFAYLATKRGDNGATDQEGA